MQIRKHSLDGGDHYPPEAASATTSQELVDETIAVSALDGGYIAILGEYGDSNSFSTPHILKVVAISGVLVENGLTP